MEKYKFSSKHIICMCFYVLETLYNGLKEWESLFPSINDSNDRVDQKEKNNLLYFLFLELISSTKPTYVGNNIWQIDSHSWLAGYIENIITVIIITNRTSRYQ